MNNTQDTITFTIHAYDSLPSQDTILTPNLLFVMGHIKHPSHSNYFNFIAKALPISNKAKMQENQCIPLRTSVAKRVNIVQLANVIFRGI